MARTKQTARKQTSGERLQESLSQIKLQEKVLLLKWVSKNHTDTDQVQ